MLLDYQVAIEKLEHRIALRGGKTFDPSGKEIVHEDRPPARFRMCANQWVGDGWILCDRTCQALGATGFGEAFAKTPPKVMHRVQAIEQPHERCR